MLSASDPVRQLADILRPALDLEPVAAAGKPDLPMAEFAATRHRVAALMFRACYGSGHVRDEADAARRFLALQAQKNAQRELRQKVAAKKITALFERERIGHVLVKGWTLGEELYGESALRQSKDVDLLIAPDRLEQALCLAADAGYRVAKTDGKNALRKALLISRHHREVSVFDCAAGVELELHSRLLPHPPNSWRDPAEDIEITIKNPHYVLYLIIHGAMSGWKRLKWPCDLAMIAQRVTPQVRSETMALAKAHQCEEAVVASLLFMADIWDAELAEPWLAETAVAPHDYKVQRHLTSFSRRLGTDEMREWRPIRILRHAGIMPEAPLFAEKPPALRKLYDNAMLSLLWKL